MTLFSSIINLIEAFICTLFVYRLFSKKLSPYLITSLIYFFWISICNYAQLPELALVLLSMLTLYTYSSFLNKGNYLQNIFIALFVNVLINISTSLGLIITSVIFRIPFNSINFLTSLTLSAKTLLIVFVILTSKYIKNHHFLENKILNYITIGIVLLNFIYSLTIDYIFYEKNFNITLNLILLLIDALAIWFCFIFFEAQKEQQHILELEKENIKIENLETVHSINEQNYQSLRKWKHDIKHIFNAISYQLDNQCYDEAKKIVNEQASKLDNNIDTILTGNIMLDYLLLQKIDDIKENKIHIIANCSNNDLPLENTHFFVIIGNLLDNAIENCDSVASKQIWITFGKINTYHYIKIKNTITKSVLKHNPELKTTKEDALQHGIGIESVKLLVEHYQGKIKLEEDDYFFIVKILIPDNNNDDDD